MDLRPVFPTLTWAEPGDEFYWHPALRRADGMGYESVKTALGPAGRQTRHGWVGDRWGIGTLPGLYQPVFIAFAYLKIVLTYGVLPL